jgi:hypothetical protein
MCIVGSQPALHMTKKHHNFGEIVQKQCWLSSSEGVITYLSVLFLLIVSITLLVGFPKPHLVISFQNPPSYKLVSPNPIHPCHHPISFLKPYHFSLPPVWLRKHRPSSQLLFGLSNPIHPPTLQLIFINFILPHTY